MCNVMTLNLALNVNRTAPSENLLWDYATRHPCTISSFSAVDSMLMSNDSRDKAIFLNMCCIASYSVVPSSQLRYQCLNVIWSDRQLPTAQNQHI